MKYNRNGSFTTECASIFFFRLENKNINNYRMSMSEYGARTLTNFDINSLVEYLKIPNYKGTFMKDQLIGKPKETECAVVNFNNSDQIGSHWVAFYKNGEQRIYFDSFGQIPPIEIQKYLKTPEEYKHNILVISPKLHILRL